MKGILLLLFLVCGLTGIAQDKSTYFAKNGSQVNNLNDAVLKIERHEIYDKKFELSEFRKYGTTWKKGVIKNVVLKKTDNLYLVSVYDRGQLTGRSNVEVIDTTTNGFVIREIKKDFVIPKPKFRPCFPEFIMGFAKTFQKMEMESLRLVASIRICAMNRFFKQQLQVSIFQKIMLIQCHSIREELTTFWTIC